ncbi:autotransporter-associated beta strand repeat protein [Chthoniobacter flavus Ellin428]|uniref:Autotransporter-associated beta strand repeat protein n=1 Tax=Chthoniobacter flavus Ellin428 TaxID=497964 RepID=B4D7T9_9BACT|nr:autotransporter-associated beta strand repeat protein [Chthoniobacter flavus Ellin428]
MLNYGVIGIGDNTALSSYNLRVPQAAGVFSNNMLIGPNTGSGVLAINSVYSLPINLATIGDGTWYLGSTNNGAGVSATSSVNGTITGTVAPGAPGNFRYTVGATSNQSSSLPTYRLGGGGNFLNIGLVGSDAAATATANIITGNANVVVGGQLTNTSNNNGAIIGNVTGTVFFNQNENYTGATLVDNGSTLEFRGTMATSGYEVFGILAAGGSGGTFAGGPAPVIRPGGLVRLDNSLDLLPASATQGRWGSSMAVNLDSGTFRVIGNAAADLTQNVGAVNIAGGSFFTPQSVFGGRVMQINAASINRVANNNGVTGSNGMVSIEPTNGSQLGTNERVTATTIANYAGTQVSPTSAIQNGMVAPWMYNNRDQQFLTYSDFGFVNAGFNLNVGNITLPASTGTGVERLLINGGTATLPVGGSINVWALRPDSSVVMATTSDTTASITIGSGGIIDGQSISLTPKLVFGSTGSPVEADIAVAANTLVIGDITNTTTSGQITATNIVKAGTGTLQMDSEQATFNGSIAVNGGGLTLRNTVAAGNTSNAGGAGGSIIINGFQSSLNLRADNNNTVFNNSVVINANNPVAIISTDRAASTSVTGNTIALAGGLTFLGSPGDQGQTLTYNTANAYNLQINGTTSLGAGYDIFNITNANSQNPNLTLAGAVTGAGTLVREGASTGTLFVGASGVNPTASNTFTGGVVILTGGNVQFNATATANGNVVNNLLGAGNNVNLLGGQLNLRVDQTNNSTFETATFTTNTVTVTGNSTINVDRVTSSGGTNKAVALSSLSIGGQTLTVSSADTYALRFNAVNLSGTPTLNTSNDLVLSHVSDSGAGLSIVKNGAGQLWFADNTSTFSGGVYVNAGTLRFGTPGAVSTTATAGTGSVQINAQGAVQLESASNIGTGKLLVDGVNPSLGVVRVGADASLTATVLSNSGVFNSASTNGDLRITTNYANALDLSNNATTGIGDGTFFLGVQQTGGTTSFSYTANTLGVGTGNVYRLGANDANTTTLILAPVTSTSTVLTGANSLQVGALAFGFNNGTGTVLLNTTNNYSGGTVISRGSTLQIASGGANTPLGSGQVDVFGTMTAQNTNGSFKTATTGNTNTFVFHPGGILRFENNVTATNADRWDDSTGIALNGSGVTIDSLNNSTSTETVGAISFSNGSRITLNSTGTGQVQLTTSGGSGNLTRNGTGTLVFVDTAAARLGAAAGNNSERFLVTGGVANINATTLNGMLPGYIVSANDNAFVNYGTNGIIATAFNNTNFGSGLTNNSLVDVTANTSLTGNVSAYAMRIAAFTLSNGTGQFDTVTLNGAGTANSAGGLIFSGTGTLNANLSFNGFEGLIYTASGVTGTINGDLSGISATGITKFGVGILAIGKDQTDLARGTGAGYSNGWNVNEGQLTPLTFGALGNAVSTNSVNLNGNVAGTATNAILPNAATLRLQLNQGNLGIAYYSMGNLNVTDLGSISYDPQSDDRTQALGAAGALSNVTITSTGGSKEDAQLYFNDARNRAILQVGTLTVSGANAGAQLYIATTTQGSNITSGISSGLSVASLAGTSDQRIEKWGSGVLYVRGSSTFAGAVNIEEGAIQVNNNGSLGTGAVTVKRFGILDVNTANFAPTNSTITYQSGAIERWTADGARTGTLDLTNGGTTTGASLQVANDQTANTLNVIMNGGSISGFLRTDDLLGTNGNRAVYRTLNSNITFTFNGNTYLGQDISQGVNGTDMGMQANAFNPLTAAANGVLLQINGAISGTGGLIKQGYDTITIASSNDTYSGGTSVTQGMLRAGATNVLGSSDNTVGNIGTGNLSTTGGGMFDLNGYDQSVGRLTSTASGFTAGTTNSTGSGYITNTATVTNTLSVGNGTTGSATDFTYGGVIQYNVAVVKNGTAVFSLTNANTYAGGTTLNSGWLQAANTTGSATGSGNVTVNGGTLAGAGTIAGTVILNSGGALEPGALTLGPVGNPTSTIGTLTVGGLTINTGSTLTFKLTTPGGSDDLVSITGTDPLSSSILNIAGAPTLNILNSGGFTTGTYKLFSFANGTDTGFSNLPLHPTSPVAGLILTTVDNTASHEIDLLVQANTTVVWSGKENQIWDTTTHASPKNWVDLTSNPADFVNNLDVTFDDTATGFAPVVSGTVQPKSISFNNATADYVLGTDGSGVIADSTLPTALAKTAAGGLTINIGTNTFSGGSTISAGTVTFGASTLVTGGTLTQGPLGVGAIALNGGTIQDNGSPITIANAINIGGNLSFDSTGSGSLTFTNEVAANQTTLIVSPTLTVASGASVTFQQPIVGSGKSLTKAGNGTLILAGANTYNGGTTVSGGVLQVNLGGSLAAGSNLTVNSGGTAALNNVGQSLGTVQANGVLNLNAAASTTTATTLNGASSGALALGTAPTTILSVANGAYNGTLTGSGVLTKAGTGADVLTLTNSGSTYTGGTNLTAGTLTLGASSIVTAGSLVSGPIGTGTLAVTAGTTINGQTAAQTIANAVNLNASVVLGGTSLTIDGTGLTSPTSITLLANASIAANSTDTFASVVTDGASTFNLTQAGTGTLALTNAASTYKGITTVNSGVLQVSKLAAGGSPSSIGQSSNAATNLVINGGTFKYAGAGDTTDRLFTIGATAGSTIDASGTGPVNFSNSGSMAFAGTTARTLTLTGSNTGANTLAAKIADSGSGVTTLVKNGGGTWALTNATSSYTGTTTINSGTLSISAMANVSVASPIGDPTTTANGTIGIGNGAGGATLQYTGAATSSNRVINLAGTTGGAALDAEGTGAWTLTSNITATGGGAKVLTLTGAAAANIVNTISGTIVDNSGTNTTGITKSGTDTWLLSNAASTNTGIVTLNNGILELQKLSAGGVASSIGQSSNLGANLVFNGGTLQYVGSGDTTDRLFTLTAFGGTIDDSGTGALTFSNTGALTYTGSGARSLTLTGSYTASSDTFAPALADGTGGSTSLIKTGASTWTVASGSTYTGSTNVLNGTLVAGSNSAFGTQTGTFTPTLNLGDVTGSNNAAVLLDATNARFITNTITARDTTGGALTLGSLNTSGTGDFAGNVVLGATANTGKGVTLGAQGGGTTVFSGRILANGTDTTAGVRTANLGGTGTATVKLAANNSYAGGTVVNSGTTVLVDSMTAGGNTSLGANVASNVVTLSGGTLQFGNNYGSGLTESYILGTGSMNTIGAGTLFASTSNVKLAELNTSGTVTRTAGQVNDTSWGSNETWVYSGQIYAPTGQISFAKSFDDGVQIKVDGNVVLNNQAVGTILGTGNLNLAPTADGWHTIEIRLFNGTGSAGAVAQGTGWTTTFGLGVSGILGKVVDNTTTSPLGTNYVSPADSGNITVFRNNLGTVAQTYANSVSVTQSSTVDLGANTSSLTLGALSINSSTLTTQATGGSGTPVVNFGATTLTGSPTFAPAASTIVTLGALNDSGTAQAITANGAGTVQLTAAATSLVDGTAVNITNGTLASNNATALGNLAAVTVTSPGAFSVGASQTIGLLAGAGTTSLNGNTLTVGSTNALSSSYSGALVNGTGTGSLIKAGNGTLSLSGNSTYTGTTGVSKGTLNLVGSGSPTLGGTAITVASTGTLGIIGNTTIGTTSVGNITINAGGTLSLLDGSINTLTLQNTTSGFLSMGSGADLALDLNPSGSVDSLSVQSLTLTGGNSIVSLNNLSAGTLSNGSYTLMSYAAGSTLNGFDFTFDGTNTVKQVGGGHTYTLVTNGTNLQLIVGTVATPTPVYWQGTQSDGSWATITNTNATNWVNGPTGTDTNQIPGSVSDVFFTANSATNLTTTLDQSFVINSLNFTGAGTTADSTNVTINNGTGSNTLTINNGVTDVSTSAAHTVNVPVVLGNDQTWSNSSTGDLTFNGNVTGVNTNLTVTGSGNTVINGAIQTGNGGLNKTGVGMLTLGSGSNTYAGTTNIAAGTVKLGADNAIPSGAGKGNVTVNGTLDVNGHNQTINGLSGTGTIDNTAAATSPTLSVGANNQTSTFGGTIQNTAGALAVNKVGTGTVTMSGANTYSGGTNVSAGTLVVSGSIQGNTTVASGATLASGANISSQVAALNAASDALGGGTVAPGNTGGVADLSTVGQLNATGAVTLGTASTAGVAHLSIEVGGNQDGSGVGPGVLNTTNSGSLQYDRVAMLGSTLTLNNANLDISPVNSFTYTDPSYNNSTQQFNLDGHIFFLITGASNVAGTFGNQQGVDPNLPGFNTIYGTDGQEFAISYQASFSGGTFTGGNDVAIMAIPEPNSMAMLAGSLGMALGLQRFRRRRIS